MLSTKSAFCEADAIRQRSTLTLALLSLEPSWLVKPRSNLLKEDDHVEESDDEPMIEVNRLFSMRLSSLTDSALQKVVNKCEEEQFLRRRRRPPAGVLEM